MFNTETSSFLNPFQHFRYFRKSAWGSHHLGPQRMTSYCGFGAPQQLDEFMVSTKERRSLSFCQTWFPLRSKCWPLQGCQGPQRYIYKRRKKVKEMEDLQSPTVIQFLHPETMARCKNLKKKNRQAMQKELKWSSYSNMFKISSSEHTRWQNQIKTAFQTSTDFSHTI